MKHLWLTSLKVRLSKILGILTNKRGTRAAHQSAYVRLGPTSTISHAEIQKHLRGPLRLEYQDPNIVVETSEIEDVLFATCIAGDVVQFEKLIQDTSTLNVALCRKRRPYANRKSYNLLLMVHMAARAGNAPMVECLLRLGNRHNIPYSELLHYLEIIAAIQSNKTEVFQKFLDVQPDCANFNMGRCGQPLNQVIGNMVDDEGRPAPHVEINYVKFLLENGADPNAPGVDSLSFGHHLACAVRRGSLEVVSLLLSYGAVVSGTGAIQDAIFEDRIDVMDLLFEHGADVNEWYQLPPEEWDWGESYGTTFATPLHFAIEAGNKRAAVWLLEHGADTSIRDSFGRTPLDIVVSIHGAIQSARVVLQKLDR